MRPNRELALAVRRALATGTIALCGVGAAAAYAQQATPPQATTAQASPVKTATQHASTAKKSTAKKSERILLAQATTVPAPADNNAPPPTLQTVVVTGTLIARPAAETAEPITIVKSDSLKNQGLTNVEQAVDQISANVPAPFNIAQSVGQFTGGGSYVNLRDLQSERTLVLVDGQRLAPNATTGLGVDISGIPFSAIDSVQVLRDGASSLYGSDAIAGVVNFITHKDYQGGEVDVNYNRPQEAGGSSGDANFIFGHGDLVNDGYNFMVTGSYSRQDELKAQQRSFSATGINIPQGLNNTNGIGTWPGTVEDGAGNEWQSGYPACSGDPLYLSRQNGECLYEYSAATDIIPDSSEASGMASFTKTLGEDNQVRLQYFYTRSKVIDWGGAMFYSYAMTPQNNPLYYTTASQLSCVGTCTAPDLTDPMSVLWSDPDNNRYFDNVNTEQRVLLTFSGTDFGWTYAANLNYSQNKAVEDALADLPDLSALADGSVDINGTSTPLLNNLINPFGPQTAAGQALINSSYINGPLSVGKDKLWSVDGHASHELGDAFNAGTPATIALGFTFGGENFNSATTPTAATLAAATGFLPAFVDGSRTTQALYAELDVPMSSHLDVDVSAREDRYSDFGQTTNGKLSVRYQPSHYVTFRGSASTGFRAPTLNNLYGPNVLGATGGTMGLGTHTSGYGNAACAAELAAGTIATATGEWTESVCDNQGLRLTGGNRNLQPETSENFDIGIVVEPIRNMGITLDYYRILLKDAISSIPYTAIYADPAAFPNQIVLNSAGTLSESISLGSQCPAYTSPTCGYVLQESVNTGFITTDGVDLSVNYVQHTPIGIFAEDLEGTAILKYDDQLYSGGPVLNLVGWYNSGNQPALRWQHTLRVTWMSPEGMWGAGLNNRLMSRYIDQLPDGNGNSRNVGTDSTWNAYGSYKPIRPLTVLVGIRNVLNHTPPFSNQLGNWSTGYNPVFSDPTLRTFYVNLKYNFL
jgi:iron complex outermembrane receptor protein